MGKKKSGGKKGVKRQRKHRVSSGKRRVSKARQELCRVKMKIKRWEKNQTDEKKKEAGKSRNGWDTTGLKKRVKQLEGHIKKGPKKFTGKSRPSMF